MLDSFESGDEQISRGYLDLISTLMLRGSVDVWYHGEYIAVPFQRLPEWFRDPTAIPNVIEGAAARHRDVFYEGS